MTPPIRCLVATVESDSHMWNLVYLQKLLEEQGAAVKNLGCCTPMAAVVEAIASFAPDLVVISSVNGNGHHQGRTLIAEARRLGFDVPFVIGGKLTTDEADNPKVHAALVQQGYADVFIGADAVRRFLAYLPSVRRAQRMAPQVA